MKPAPIGTTPVARDTQLVVRYRMTSRERLQGKKTTLPEHALSEAWVTAGEEGTSRGPPGGWHHAPAVSTRPAGRSALKRRLARITTAPPPAGAGTARPTRPGPPPAPGRRGRPRARPRRSPWPTPSPSP